MPFLLEKVTKPSLKNFPISLGSPYLTFDAYDLGFSIFVSLGFGGGDGGTRHRRRCRGRGWFRSSAGGDLPRSEWG